MTLPLLTTKLYFPPARPNLVPRPRLVERLCSGLCRSLTLLSAPPGSGKTTLLSEWRLGPGRSFPIAWLSLDPGDNDLSRFFTYLTAAADALAPGLAGDVRAMIGSPQPLPVETLLISFLNSLSSFPNDFALALDDYHVITSASVHEAIAYLLDHLPPNVHLVLLTRADPPLPLARLRARDQLVEIRAADLRFSPQEAGAFLNDRMGLGLSSAGLAALEARTEGWIAGLQLAALSMHGLEDSAGFLSAFSGSHRFVVDYLVEEVLNRQPPQVSEFLLRTSILDRFCAPLCDTIIRDEGARSVDQSVTRAVSPFIPDPSSSILDTLERSNLFIIPLDDERHWFRYHHLFADLMRSRLSSTRPDLVPELHRRASAWYRANGLIPEAVQHALAGGHFELAAEIIERVGRATLASGGWGMLQFWLRALPVGLIRSRPSLALLFAWGLVLTGQSEGIESHLESAERSLEQAAAEGSGNGPVDSLSGWEGEIAAIRSRAAYLRGSFRQSIEYSFQAFPLLPESELVVRGILSITQGISYLCLGDLDQARRVLEEAHRLNESAGNLPFALDAAGTLAQIHEAQGRLHLAASIYREILSLSPSPFDPNVAAAHLNLAGVLYEWHDLDGAREHLETCLALSRATHLPDAILVATVQLARVKLAQGDRETAGELLRQGRMLWASFPESIIKQNAEALIARAALGCGDLDTAELWSAGYILPPDERLSVNFILGKIEYLTLARVRLAQEKAVEALNLLGKLQHVASDTGLSGCLTEILALEALSRQAQGDLVGSLACLSDALQCAAPEGILGIFVDLGAPMKDLLVHLVSPDRLSREVFLPVGEQPWLPHLVRLLEIIGIQFDPSLVQPAPQATLGGQSSLPEPLSERELEVLRLVAAGRSNREIAGDLVLALGTVKKHINNIFSKLTVESRTQAIAIARDLHLL